MVLVIPQKHKRCISQIRSQTLGSHDHQMYTPEAQKSWFSCHIYTDIHNVNTRKEPHGTAHHSAWKKGQSGLNKINKPPCSDSNPLMNRQSGRGFFYGKSLLLHICLIVRRSMALTHRDWIQTTQPSSQQSIAFSPNDQEQNHERETKSPLQAPATRGRYCLTETRKKPQPKLVGPIC